MFYFEIAVKWTKISKFKKILTGTCVYKTPSKMHLHDMVTIDTTVLEIIGCRGGGLLDPPRIG